jgi:hypothetical protein
MNPDTPGIHAPGLAGLGALEPWLLGLHLLGVVVVVGSVVVMNLRLLGLGRVLPVRALHGFLIPLCLVALLAVVPSGLALFALHAQALIGRGVFFYKMLLLFAAAINALIFYTGSFQTVASWDAGRLPPAGARLAALVSLLIWIAVIGCGQSLVRDLA